MDTITQITDRVLESTVTAPATVIKAPPGAGKSYLAALIAGMHTAGLGHSIAIATPTREQGMDLARNITAAYPDVTTVWHAPRPAPGLDHAKSPKDLPAGPHVAVGTLAKWAFYTPDTHEGAYDLLLIDEAWQVTDATLATVAHVAARYVLIGDPGQIAPVVTADMSEWADQPDAPTLPAPEVLAHRHPSTPFFELPSTRRFGPRTAALVSQAFYDFDWDSIAPATTITGTGIPALDEGAEIAASVLPTDPGVGRADPGVAAHIASLAQQIHQHAHITRDGTPEPVGTIYVVAAHIDQVAAVRAATAGMDVVVDTAERLQGRQANVVIAWHPASGSTPIGAFQRDTGRLCVMLSRHKAACIVVMREDTLDRLGAYESTGRAVTGADADYLAWRSTRDVTSWLHSTAHRTN